MNDPFEFDLGGDLEITKTTPRGSGGGTWTEGTIAGHRFSALVFPEHAESQEYEIDNIRISKLWIQRLADRRTVYNWDRGLDQEAETDLAQEIVNFLAVGLADHILGNERTDADGKPPMTGAVDQETFETVIRQNLSPEAVATIIALLQPAAFYKPANEDAAQVLAKAENPMNAKELIEAMATQKLWTSPGGKTPHATLYSAILREINTKGKDARFKKVERGQFATNG